MEETLQTTNILLGIMAVVSVLEGLVLIGAAVMGYRAYTQVMTLIRDLEARQVAPLVNRASAILDDVKQVTARATQQAERVDQAIRHTMDRVDDTAERVSSSVRDRAERAVGVIRGLRSAIESVLSGGTGRRVVG